MTSVKVNLGSILILPVLLLSVLLDLSTGKVKWTCREKCDGGERNLMSLLRNGSYTCYSIPEKNRNGAQTSCYIECMGYEIPEDQTKCWCDFCKDEERSGHENFCTQPNIKHINPEDCETHVCSGDGKAKYRFKYCDDDNWGGAVDKEHGFE